MINVTTLTNLMAQGRDDHAIVAIDGEQSIHWQEFNLRVADWYTAITQHPGQTLGIYLTDSNDFAAALFALWHAGKTACIPGDNLPGTTDNLMTQVTALIGDFPTSTLPLIKPVRTNSTPQWLPLSEQQNVVKIFTSGSTGSPKAVNIRLQQLDDEVAILEQLWGENMKHHPVAGTASHQHLYGLIFRILWPIAAGRPFFTKASSYVEELVLQLQTHKQLSVVTTPSHLTRLPEALPWESLKGQWCTLFSSTAPLFADASQNALKHFGVPVTEIFGSSETGGIAWRQQIDPEANYWQTLPGITISQDEKTEALILNSPLLAEQQPLVTSDRIEYINKESFHLLGRIDRIVKVEGKRLSLTAMEDILTKHPMVEVARALLLEGKRAETAVVIQLNSQGQQFLQSKDKRSLNTIFKELLKPHFEAPVLPRRWRYRNQLPQNSQGKISLQSLEKLFEQQQPMSNKLPHILECKITAASEITLSLYIPPELVYFDGHFSEAPILPGVVQVHWAEYFGRKYFGQHMPDRKNFTGLEAVKFQQIIRPKATLNLDLKYQDNKSKLHFRFYTGLLQHSTGRIVWEPNV